MTIDEFIGSDNRGTVEERLEFLERNIAIYVNALNRLVDMQSKMNDKIIESIELLAGLIDDKEEE